MRASRCRGRGASPRSRVRRQVRPLTALRCRVKRSRRHGMPDALLRTVAWQPSLPIPAARAPRHRGPGRRRQPHQASRRVRKARGSPRARPGPLPVPPGARNPGKRDGDPPGEAFEVPRELLNGGVDEPRVWHPAAFLRACCGLCGFSQTIERRIDADDQLAGPGAGRVQRRAPVSSAEVNGQPLRVGRQEVQDGLTVDNADALALYHAHGQTPRVIEAKCSAPAHCLPPCLAHHVELREECRSPDRLTWYG